MSKPKIYIAGKVTGEPKHTCALKFAMAAKEVEALGFEAINPIAVVKDFNAKWNHAMKLCIAELLKADALYHLPCAKFSKGAQIELQLARDLKTPTFYELETLKNNFKQ